MTPERIGFVVGGVQKGGTTALDAYLRQHPQLSLPAAGKELHFFDAPEFVLDAASIAGYHARFPAPATGCVRGEVTPIYVYWHSAAGRIHAYNPEMKWIIVLRNPAERAYSHWRMQRGRGLESLEFEAALAAEPARIAAAQPVQERLHSYADRGFYADQLRRVYGLFGRERCLVLLNEELRAEPAATLFRIHDFLGVERIAPVEVGFQSFESVAPPLEPAVRGRLLDRYREDVAEVERLTGCSLQHWL